MNSSQLCQMLANYHRKLATEACSTSCRSVITPDLAQRLRMSPADTTAARRSWNAFTNASNKPPCGDPRQMTARHFPERSLTFRTMRNDKCRFFCVQLKIHGQGVRAKTSAVKLTVGHLRKTKYWTN